MSDKRDDPQPDRMPRRVALRVIGGGVPAVLVAGGAEARTAQEPAAQPEPLAPAATEAATPDGYEWKFFTEEERHTAALLADMIIPSDQVSGSASDAGVLEYVDEYADFWGDPVQVQLRGGLLWLDRECRRRFDRAFADCDEAQRKAVLDDIAYPERLPPELVEAAEASVARPQLEPRSETERPRPPVLQPAEPLDPELERLRHGIAFFILFRDLVAGGFYTSRIGIEDLRFIGNMPIDWRGCPPHVLRKLGLDS